MASRSAHGRRAARAGNRAAAGALALLGTLAGSSPLAAHEVRPAYLELTEVAAGRFDVLWKQPVLPISEPGMTARLPLEPRFPDPCRVVDRALPEVTRSALVERWTMDCGASGLAGTIEIEGLPRTLTDVLLRVRRLDGSAVDRLLRPEAPRTAVATEASPGVAVPAYLRLGVEHLLFGFDHILFVVGLLFCVRRPLQLVQVVTAFTAAHSVTLALSTLGVVTLPPRPVEAAIALSILYLAVELVRAGPPGAVGGAAPSLAARAPWAVAFGFGLLHGFGFAGALGEIGLPAEAQAMALLFFNVGVELGQLAVVGVLLVLVRLVSLRQAPLPAAAVAAPVYGMGIVSAYWFVERVASMAPPLP